MAPTISAISEISLSPRTKVLVERKEKAWSQVSVLEAKSLIDVELIDVVEDVFSSVAPLVSDDHRPPYDPKTNYLSPRPRFLYYKPKPRVENLQDSFTSESSSDAESTEEESVSSASEDDPFYELLHHEEDREPLVPKLEPETTPLKESQKSKYGSFERMEILKIVPFVLVFAIACFFIPLTDTPVLFPYVHSYKFDGAANIIEYTKENFNELASKLKVLSAKTVSYVSSLVSIPGVLEETGPSYLSNFNEGPLVVDEYQVKGFGDSEKDNELELDQIDMVAEIGRETEEMPKEEKDNVELPTLEDVGTVVAEKESYIDLEEYPGLIEPEIVQEFAVYEEEELDTMVAEQDSYIELEEYPSLIESETVQEFEVYEEEKLDSDANPKPTGNIQVIPESSESSVSYSSSPVENSFDIFRPPSTSLDVASNEQVHILESGSQPLGNLFQVQNVVGIVSAVLTVVAAYLYVEHCKSTTLEFQKSSQPVQEKKKISAISAYGDSEDKISSRLTEVEMGVDSGLSKMSSGFKSCFTYGPRGSERVNEAESHEMRLKYSDKEALLSSSEFSYGSFTTNVKLHIKRADGEDEVLTPVRRSSRIRKITSP